jgi:hypothetical protein
MLHCIKAWFGACDMLEEWIRNVSLAELKAIAADSKVQGSRIWQLAVVELLVRQNQEALAA